MFNNSALRIRFRRYFTFKYLMLVLVVLFFVRHGMRIDIHVGDVAASVPTNLSPTLDHQQEPKAQLASLKRTAKSNGKSRSPDIASLRQNYIETFAPIAQVEMKAHGIPASITLAQGLLESVAGTSRLATRTNNHFGIKCFKRSCKRGHCLNFEDDHHKDFFRNYENPADSYSAHSAFLTKGTRYKKLFKLSPKDYKAWAKGLRKAGYATDPKYANKLISLIERYELAKYDS